MKTFHFVDTIPLDFEGLTVFVPLKTAKEKLEESIKTVIPQCQLILESGENAENIKKCTEVMRNFLSEFIGEKNFAAIFDGREIGFPDLCDVYRYICEEVKDFAAEKIKTVGEDEHTDA